MSKKNSRNTKSKIVSVFLVFVMVFSFFGCKTADEDGPTGEGTTTITDIAGADGKSATLMVYMVGSDLESKGGAATNDLQEMADSGVDLSKVNVVVYAGGSKKWHNDNISEDSGHTILQLTDKGFTTLETKESASMGTSESLSGFLNYATEKFPANSYSLILWDHGNGPLIGYGKDMLFDGDSLSLAEMKKALDDSPFNSDNKLAWVGFDACLMASAELSILWKDYADYLIASQEIEPSFGWNYAFLSDITGDRTKLFESITGGYLDFCEEYYEKKGFSDRDTTLSCMDLSYAGELETAINTLFKKASDKIDSSFNSLSVSRANTRALGRASTNSEYDLIDLNDMASQMSADYPTETKAVQDVLAKMTVSNKTNAENLSGMSLYYPFYNKTHYEESWGTVYSELGVLSDYADYLSSYTDIWLEDDKLENTAESNIPKKETAGKFTLELTDAQAENFASAKYYILSKQGHELYLPIFDSADVTKNGNTLTANFDGNVLYAKSGLGEYALPATTQHDTVGDITRYSFYTNLVNETPLLMDKPEDFEHRVEGYRFQVAANTKTKEISKSALVPYSVGVDSNTLMGGKLEDADLSQWTTYYILSEKHIYLSRYDNGAIRPLDQWLESDFLSGYTMQVGDGIEFLFAPLTTGDYSIVIEVTDTQNNRYCSELLEFSTTGTLEEPEAEKVTEVSWTDGDSVELFTEQGITMHLTTVNNGSSTNYALKASNSNDFSVAVLGGDVYYNDNIYCNGATFGYFSVHPDSTATDSTGFIFGDAETLGFLTSETPLDSITFSVSVVTYTGEKTIINKKWVKVNLSDKTNFMPEPVTVDDFQFFRNFYHLPSNDILATEQKLFEKNGLKATLVGLGGNGKENSAIVGALKIENTTSSQKVFNIEGQIFDGIFLADASGPITVPASSTLYKQIYVSNTEMQKLGIISPSSVSLCFKFSEFATLAGGGGFGEWEQYPVTLSQKGSGCSLAAGSELVYNENSIKVYQKEIVHSTEDWNVYDKIIFTVENNSGQDIKIEPANYYLNSDSLADDDLKQLAYSIGAVCPDGTSTILEINTYKDYADSITFKTDIVVMDISGERILFPDAVKSVEIKVR